jgi:serine/threonine protein kinase
LATETIIGSYRIEECIGRGGMGIVYRGRHLQLPREVAIKSIDASASHDLRRLKPRFEKEAYIQSQLDHPGIVKVYDYIVGQQTYYIVMEYVRGRSLAEVCASHECPLPAKRALDIFEQILKAVSYAHSFVYRDQDESLHRGLVHRDLKPANILLTPEDHVKVADFGIVKLVGSENTDTFGSYGSPQYVSPEQAGDLHVDQRSDIYSLGIILYEMLTGSTPFGGKDKKFSRTSILRAHVEETPRAPSEINEEITPEVESLILRALEKEPDKRFPTVLEFLRAVRHARGHTTSDLAEKEIASSQERESVGTEEIHDVATEHALRETYVTQPIGASTCAACGTHSTPEDKHCRVCGHELNASPATVRLTRQEAAVWQTHRKRSLWIAGTLLVIGLSSLGVIYMTRERPDQTVKHEIQPTPFASPARQTPIPASALIELRPARVVVDSSYEGYTTKPLTDGETDVNKISRMRYNTGNWASAETHTPHWIEVGLERPISISAVYIYWGFDRNRFMPSRRVELQTLNESGEWHSLSVMEPGNDRDRMAFEFAPVKTDRVRIFQPAQQGPPNRPFVMWVREIKVYGISE